MELGNIEKVIIVMGLFAFAKQAPKLIGDILGIDSGKIKLGIGSKLAAGGAFGVGAVLAGGLGTGFRNAISGIKNGKSDFKSAQGFINKTKAIVGASRRTLASTAAGAVSGGFRSAKGGFTAKNFKDMRNSISEGTKAAESKRTSRENYKANHGGNFAGVIGGHARDVVSSLGEAAGITTNIEDLKKVQSKVNEVSNARKAIDDRLDAILQKNKDKYTSRTQYGALDIGLFDNYGELLNELEIMKSTGKTSGKNGRVKNVTSDMLSRMNKAESDMRKAMKSDILAGYDLENNPNAKFNPDDFKLKYDAQLESLITDYRTKAYQNIKTISDNADKTITKVNDSINDLTTQAIDNKDQKLYEFVSSDNITKLFDEDTALKNASRNIDVKVANRYQEEAKKGKDKN